MIIATAAFLIYLILKQYVITSLVFRCDKRATVREYSAHKECDIRYDNS